MVETPGAGQWSVAPQDAARRTDLEDRARAAVVRDEHVAPGVELGVRRVADGNVDVEHDLARRAEPDDPRAADLGDQQPAVGERRVTVRVVEAGRRSTAARSGSAPMANDLLREVDLEDPAVADVGNDDVAVGERVGIVRRVKEPGGRPERVVVAILPDHLAARDIDAVDDLVRLVVGHDRPPVTREEGIVGREPLTLRQAAGPRELPQDPFCVVDHEESAVAAICDQQAETETAS